MNISAYCNLEPRDFTICKTLIFNRGKFKPDTKSFLYGTTGAEIQLMWNENVAIFRETKGSYI